jgi:hypothetical protein
VHILLGDLIVKVGDKIFWNEQSGMRVYMKLAMVIGLE